MNPIDLSPSPRALHFAAIWPRRTFIFSLVSGLGLLCLNFLVIRGMIRNPELVDFGISVTLIIFLILNWGLMISLWENFKKSKQLTDMLKPNRAPKVEIDKESKMIHFVNYMGKTYDYRYDLLLTAKLTDPNNKFEKKHGFFSIEVKYLVFDENDINIKTAQFNYLENAAELVSLISQGELSIGQIKDNLLPQA